MWEQTTDGISSERGSERTETATAPPGPTPATGKMCCSGGRENLLANSSPEIIKIIKILFFFVIFGFLSKYSLMQVGHLIFTVCP